jgi:TonB-linked SusC/RagA family outer membrane protein
MSMKTVLRSCLLSGILLLSYGLSIAQDRVVSGNVSSSADGNPIPGVNVVIKGTTTGTTTDFEGNYKVAVPDNAVLVFSFVGFADQEITVGNQSTIDVSLDEDITKLTEVVVTAFGVEREKKALGYSVSTVGSEDIATVKESNFINSLNGRVAGVQITQSTSGPAGGARVVIRGNSSLTGNNQPLYVVDGMPVDNSGFGSANDDGTAEYRRDDYGTGISDINPDDIESVSVLKGPNAAALYGSRAANGVIMITTKKGSGRKGLGVSFSTSMTFSNPGLLPSYQNEYGQGTLEAVDTDPTNFQGTSWGAKLDGSQQVYWDNADGTTKAYSARPDNVKNFFQTGTSYINTLAVEGGSENASMRFSYTNNKTNSMMENSYIKKHNFNLRANVNLTSKFSLDAKATYFLQDATQRAIQGTEGVMSLLYTVPRNLIMDDYREYKNADGSFNSYGGNRGNPFWVLYNDINDDTRNRFTGFAKLNYEFTDYLTVFARVGTDLVSHKIEVVEQPGHWYYPTGRFNYSNNKVSETNADFLIMFNKNLGSTMHLNLNVGANHRYGTYEATRITGRDFKIPSRPTTASAAITNPTYTPLEERIVNSVYASASLSYNDLIYLDLSGRNDWSSTLPSDNRSYFYPAASLSFMLGEVIDPNRNIFNFFKLRGGWAQVGNDTEPYQLENAYNLEPSDLSYNGLTILTRPDTYNDPNLKPEKISSTEFGLETKMFENKLYFDFSYYTIKSEDLIQTVAVSGLSGYANIHTNVGEVNNKGFEFLLGGTPFRSDNFTWDISLNFSQNKNTLVSLIEGVDNHIFTTTNANPQVTVQATVGGGFGEIWGSDFNRTADGRLIVDATGRPTATTDKVILGNYQPDFTSGLSNTLNYKNFVLRFLIDGRFGGELYSGTDSRLDQTGVSLKTLEFRETGIIVDGVVDDGTGTPENPNYVVNTLSITAQQYHGSIAGRVAASNIISQTNVRLREMSLSYNFPTSILGDSFIKDVSVSLIARNLFYFYKDSENFDPESGYSTNNNSQGVLYYNLPTPRTVGFNINVQF